MFVFSVSTGLLSTSSGFLAGSYINGKENFCQSGHHQGESDESVNKVF